VLKFAGAVMSCLARWPDFLPTGDRMDREPRCERRRVLGRPAMVVALALLSVAGLSLWRLFEIPPGICGLPVAAAVIGAAFFIAAALGVICLDMLIRWME
jgi:hypothetical protein